MLSPNRYTAEALQTQHSNEIPWTAEQNVAQPAPEQPPVSAVVESTPAVPAIRFVAPRGQDDPNEAPYLDPAEPILAADTTLDDETRANVWDAYHNSRSLEDLVRNLSPLEIPDITRQTLLAAKSVTAPAVTPVEKAANALRQMAKVDPQTLALADKFPKIAKMIFDAAVKSDEE